jgi:hypothetical protein
MKPFVFILFSFFTICSTQGQAPDWSINARNYEFSMSFTAVLNINGRRLVNQSDLVAAFVNDEIRGVGNVSYDAHDDKYVVFLRVFANTINETIQFKVYDSTNDEVMSIPKTINFEIDASVGGVFQSYSIATPTLSNEASINSFSFQGITEISNSQENNTYNLILPKGTDVSSLTPVFTLPSNARLYIGFVRQESGISSQDFSNPISYTVLSADETVLANFTVEVSVFEGVASISTILKSNNSTITNNTIITLNLELNIAVIEVEKDDFNISNGVIKSIIKKSNLLYEIEIAPINQGLVEIFVIGNKIQDENGNVNTNSNTLSFNFDNFKPFVSSILRNDPSEEVTNKNSIVFTITFSENVQNVVADSFESVENAIINLTQQTEQTYDVTITNVQLYTGTISLKIKTSNSITDSASNVLRNTNPIDF